MRRKSLAEVLRTVLHNISLISYAFSFFLPPSFPSLLGDVLRNLACNGNITLSRKLTSTNLLTSKCGKRPKNSVDSLAESVPVPLNSCWSGRKTASKYGRMFPNRKPQISTSFGMSLSSGRVSRVGSRVSMPVSKRSRTSSNSWPEERRS